MLAHAAQSTIAHSLNLAHALPRTFQRGGVELTSLEFIAACAAVFDTGRRDSGSTPIKRTGVVAALISGFLRVRAHAPWSWSLQLALHLPRSLLEAPQFIERQQQLKCFTLASLLAGASPGSSTYAACLLYLPHEHITRCRSLACCVFSSVASQASPQSSARSLLHPRPFTSYSYAHIQAVELSDWTALVQPTDLNQPSELRHAGSQPPVPTGSVAELSPRFASPSAASANATLIVLNGWGFGEHWGGGESFGDDASNETGGGAGAAAAPSPPFNRQHQHRQSATTPRLLHRVGHRGHRWLFDDPLPALVGQLQPGGRHVVQYGNDHSLSERALRGFYRARLGASLAAYAAPNLSPAAASLPYALEVPLGLNSNGKGLSEVIWQGLMREYSETGLAPAAWRGRLYPTSVPL